MDTNKIFNFLNALKSNNNREWFQKNKAVYLEANEVVKELAFEFYALLEAKAPEISGQDPSKTLFRIYRDVRFSKNKDPYKTNFGFYFTTDGKKSMKGGYYVHLEAGNCFMAGGIHQADATVLRNVRQEIDYNLEEFKSLLEEKKLKKTFGKIQGESLKRPPKNYTEDNPAIDLLKMKQWYFMHQFDEKELSSLAGRKKLAEKLLLMKPVNDFLNRSF